MLQSHQLTAWPHWKNSQHPPFIHSPTQPWTHHTVKFSISHDIPIKPNHAHTKKKKKQSFFPNPSYTITKPINTHNHIDKKLHLFPVILLHFPLTPTNSPKLPYGMKIKPKLHKTQFSNFPSFKNKQIFLHPYSHSLTHISPTYPCSLSQTHNNPSFFSLLPNPSSPNIEPNWDPTCTFPFHSHNLQNQKPPPTPFSKSTSFPDTHTQKNTFQTLNRKTTICHTPQSQSARTTAESRCEERGVHKICVHRQWERKRERNDIFIRTLRLKSSWCLYCILSVTYIQRYVPKYIHICIHMVVIRIMLYC